MSRKKDDLSGFQSVKTALAAWFQASSNGDGKCVVHYAVSSQLTFAFTTFATKQVTTERFLVFDFALSGQFEPLLHSFVSFLLGHD